MASLASRLVGNLECTGLLLSLSASGPARTPVSPFGGNREFNDQAENWVEGCVGCVKGVLVGWVRRRQSCGGERLQSCESFIVPTCDLAIVLYCSFIAFLIEFLITLSNTCSDPSQNLE